MGESRFDCCPDKQRGKDRLNGIQADRTMSLYSVSVVLT